MRERERERERWGEECVSLCIASLVLDVFSECVNGRIHYILVVDVIYSTVYLQTEPLISVLG